jgi:hemerythrin superfamily protein
MPPKKTQDAIALLKNDHRTVEKLFSRYEGLSQRAVKGAQDVVQRVVKELSMHAAVEEQLLYPTVRRELPGGEHMAEEAIREHQEVKERLVRIEKLDVAKERAALDREMEALIRDVRHHVKEEEGEMFPELRNHVDRKRLVEMGELMAAAKKIAPTHPHPHAPATPPGNLVTGAAAGVMDRARDALREARRSRT